MVSDHWSSYSPRYSDAPSTHEYWIAYIAIDIILSEVFLSSSTFHCDIIQCRTDSELSHDIMVAESFASFTLWISSCKHLLGQHLIVYWHSTMSLYGVLWWHRRCRSHAVRWHLVRYRWRYGVDRWQVAYVPTNWRITDICSWVVILSDLLGLVHLVNHSKDTVDLTLDLVEVWHNLTYNDLSYQVHSSLVYGHTILVLLQHWLRGGGVLWECLLYTCPWSSLLFVVS